MPFTVLFEGLVCHIGRDANHKRHAALISDIPEHKATLQYNGEPPIDLVERDTVTFSSGPGVARTTDKFRNRVPSLEPMIPTGQTIHNPVLLGEQHGDVLAYVVFPDGELDAPEVADHPLDFDDSANVFLGKRCVAMRVVFTADRNARMMIQSGVRQTRYDLNDGDVVRIKNVSSGEAGHFELYRRLTTSSVFGKATADTERKCKQQPQQLAGRETAPHPECSNSNWP